MDPSVGRKGKYASAFHPQGPKSIAIPSARSSRPLTVGEIQANWIEYLLDSVLLRYAINRTNPVPSLQACVERLDVRPCPKRNTWICDAIQDSSSQVVVVVPCIDELPIVTDMLPSIDVLNQVDDLKSISSSCLVIGTEQEVITALCQQHPQVHFVETQPKSFKI